MTENRGQVHKYIEGITINYSITGKIAFTMIDYLEDVIVEWAENLKISHSYCPGSNQLFKVDEDSTRLPPKKAELFHHHVTRLFDEFQ